MGLVIGNRQFSPGLFTSAIALLTLVLFVKLGLWQLDRAAYKRELYQAFLSQQQAPATELGLIDFGSDDKALLWKTVKSSGQFNETLRFLLDNQTRKGQQGYYVYGLFKPADQDKWLLVNRGWLKANPDRSLVPELKTMSEEIEISGVLKQTPKTGMLLEEVTPEKMPQGIYRLQKIDIAEIEQLADVSLLPLVLQMDANSDHGYNRQWSLPGSDENKHFGYAFQWFAFATTLLIIYLTVNFKKLD